MPRGPRGTHSPRSPAVFSCPVPRWLEFSTPSLPPTPPLFPKFPRKATILKIFLNSFLKKRAWSPLYLVVHQFPVTLSFLIMKIKSFFEYNTYKEISNWLQIWKKYSPKFPEIPRTPNSRTGGIDFSFPDPRGMTNCHSPIPGIPEEWKLPVNWHS